MISMSKNNTVHLASVPSLSGRARLLFGDFSLEKGVLVLAVLCTVLAEMGELSFGGFSFRGWAWVIMLVGSAFFMLPNRFRNPVRCNWWIWIPWVLWMIEKTDFSNRDAAQRFFIFLTPLLTMAACSSLKHVTIDALKKAMHLLGVLSVLLYCVAVLSARSLTALSGWYSIAGIAMTFTFLAVSASAGQWHSLKTTLLWLGGYYLIMLFTESRMPVIVIPILAVFGYNSIRPLLKFLLMGTVVLLALAAFYTEPVQLNLFHQGFGSMRELFSFDPEVVNLSGRLNAWPQFLGGIENRWLGDGATSSAIFGYATFRGWTHPHNAYIRILFDYGYVGFALLTIPVGCLFISLFQRGWLCRNNRNTRWLFATAINGLLCMLLLGISGNVLMYIAYIGNILFALIGCSYAIDPRDGEA